jgi:membrane protein DedA with SNARE-associated domain
MFTHLPFLNTQAALALSVFLLTFAYEDGATLLAVTLGTAGRLDPRLGLASAVLGIWGGDVGLYWVGATLGGRFEQSRWAQRFVSPEAYSRARSWFQRSAISTIVLSRFIPGSRLPLYVAAGALKQPARLFASVTGICAIVWVSAIYVASRFATISHLSHGRSFAIFAVALLAGPWVLAKLFRSVIPSIRLIWKRYSRWEFWPAWVFYPPVVAMYVWFSVRYRGWTLPTIANPSFRNGGLIGESKIEILKALMGASSDCVADGYPVRAGAQLQRMEEFRRICQEQSVDYPLVLKPNVGQRGAGFRLISSQAEAEEYLNQVTPDVILQRYVPCKKEIGVFYYRFPGQACGTIFAVTEKVFPTLIGDGASTFEQLLNKDERASRIAATYLRRFSALRNQVPPAGDQVRLVEAGNHCQGCIFRDGSHLISEGLQARIDEISRRIPGFFIGRYDIRYASEKDLARGQFKIIELNGAASEATNIYDERNSLLSAYRTLYRQWELVFRIGDANRDRGYRTLSAFELMRDARSYVSLSQTYPAAD